MLKPVLFAALLAGSRAMAAPAPALLDQKGIHAAYNEGDFENVMKDIETFTSTHATYSHSDSIFIAKHLAVVYSANPGTREKGKYFMFRLLELLPSAKLVDMFVSDEIDRIFEKVREEYITRQKAFGVEETEMLPRRAPATTQAAPEAGGAAASVKPAPKSGSGKALWIASGAVLTTVGVAAVYFLAIADNPKEDKVYDVP